MASGIITRQLVEAGEWRLRLDWHNIIEKQRKEFPVREAIAIGGAPAETITDWQNQISDWFLMRRDFWWRVWNKAIEAGGVKLTTQEAYDEWLEGRANEIGLQLAAVNTKTIGEVFRLHAVGSVQNLTRELKGSIGLQPRQFTAFVNQSVAIDKRFPNDPARARRFKDRLYQQKINYRAQLIARAEMSEGVNGAQFADIQGRITRGELPNAMEKSWSDVGDGRVSDGCLLNSADGWIPLDNEFNSGDERPPRFPGCRCGAQFRKARLAA